MQGLSCSSEYRDLVSSLLDVWSKLQLLKLLTGVEDPGVARCGFSGDARPLPEAPHSQGSTQPCPRPPEELDSLLPSTSWGWAGKPRFLLQLWAMAWAPFS